MNASPNGICIYIYAMQLEIPVARTLGMLGERSGKMVFVIRYKRSSDGFCVQCLQPIPNGTRHYTVDTAGGTGYKSIRVHMKCIGAYGERLKKLGIELVISKIKREHKHARRP